MKPLQIHSYLLLFVGLLLVGAGCGNKPAASSTSKHHYTREEIRDLYMKRLRPGGPGAQPPAGLKAKAPAPTR